MSEQEPTPERQYDSPRDAALHLMAESGWATASTGEVGSPTGPVSRISNSPAELAELARVFGDDYRRLGVQPEQLVGHFLLGELTEANRGLVIEFESEQQLVSSFDALKDAYEAWRAEQL